MTQRYQGRLELTWTNKDWRLLAHDQSSYEWVPPHDYRVSEVRLLRDAGAVGAARADSALEKDNLLIRGDALSALTSLASLPRFAAQLVGKVKLVYIDPPFNTGQAFDSYDDNLEHSVWLTMMRDRLLQVKKLLAPDGLVWVHLDDAEMPYCRIILDEVFGRENFIATVIWEKSDSPRMDAKNFSVRHDYMLVFGASEAASVRGMKYDQAAQAHYNRTDDDGKVYAIDPLRMRGVNAARSARPNLYYPLTAPDGTIVYPKTPDGEDGTWRWGRERVERDSHLVEWVEGRAGWTPYRRVYPKADATKPPETIWPHAEVGSNRTSKAEIKKLFPKSPPFDTPKPEALIQRVIELSTEEGDIVLDCFAGSGTTAAVAHKLNRRWVTSEWSEQVFSTYTLPRLKKVVDGDDPGGVSGACEWEGGGGFRMLEVAPSMFEAGEGVVYLADWAVNGQLAEATAAQLGYSYEPDGPLAGRKGRTRLAVVDGLVNGSVVQLLSEQLLPDERLVIWGTRLDAEAWDQGKSDVPGSRVRKIPSSILAEYRLGWRKERRATLIPDPKVDD